MTMHLPLHHSSQRFLPTTSRARAHKKTRTNKSKCINSEKQRGNPTQLHLNLIFFPSKYANHNSFLRRENPVWRELIAPIFSFVQIYSVKSNEECYSLKTISKERCMPKTFSSYSQERRDIPCKRNYICCFVQKEKGHVDRM